MTYHEKVFFPWVNDENGSRFVLARLIISTNNQNHMLTL